MEKGREKKIRHRFLFHVARIQIPETLSCMVAGADRPPSTLGGRRGTNCQRRPTRENHDERGQSERARERRRGRGRVRAWPTATWRKAQRTWRPRAGPLILGARPDDGTAPEKRKTGTAAARPFLRGPRTMGPASAPPSSPSTSPSPSLHLFHPILLRSSPHLASLIPPCSTSTCWQNLLLVLFLSQKEVVFFFIGAATAKASRSLPPPLPRRWVLPRLGRARAGGIRASVEKRRCLDTGERSIWLLSVSFASCSFSVCLDSDIRYRPGKG